ncbi:MAG: hydrolase [Spirochaetaceae bacterium]
MADAHIPDRSEALTLMQSHIQDENLRRHCLAVEAVMRHFAGESGEDEEKWGIIGLVHDLDWEEHPEDHCTYTERWLREAGWPEDYIHAVMSHAWGMCTDVEPVHHMEKVLYTIDELTGLVTATALVRPSRSLHDLSVKSVRKKWKEKSFAAGANRDVIERGAGMVGMELSEVIEHTIRGMRAVAPELGLEGSAA